MDTASFWRSTISPPTTRATSSDWPNDGGWACRIQVLSDGLSSWTAVA